MSTIHLCDRAILQCQDATYNNASLCLLSVTNALTQTQKCLDELDQFISESPGSIQIAAAGQLATVLSQEENRLSGLRNALEKLQKAGRAGEVLKETNRLLQFSATLEKKEEGERCEK